MGEITGLSKATLNNLSSKSREVGIPHGGKGRKRNPSNERIRTYSDVSSIASSASSCPMLLSSSSSSGPPSGRRTTVIMTPDQVTPSMELNGDVIKYDPDMKVDP